MPGKSFDEKLSRLKKLGKDLHPGDAAGEIRRALSGSSGILAAEAARAAVRLGLSELTPEIAGVYQRFLKNPVKTDPGCHAKIAVVEALSEFECSDADIFLHGIRYVQMEPAFGPPVDTADRLRAACVFALFRMGHHELPFAAVSLLADREPAVRQAAVKVLAETGQEWCELLLRMKVLHRNEEPEILGDCFQGLMAIAPGYSLPFVERYLLSEDFAVAEEAALAIGNSRSQEAFELLRRHREESADSSFKRMLLLPIALTRCEGAFTLLLDVVKNEHPVYAAAAVEALPVYGHNPERHEEIREAVSTRKEPAVSEAYRKSFDR